MALATHSYVMISEQKNNAAHYAEAKLGGGGVVWGRDGELTISSCDEKHTDSIQ